MIYNVIRHLFLTLKCAPKIQGKVKNGMTCLTIRKYVTPSLIGYNEHALTFDELNILQPLTNTRVVIG